MVDYWLRAKAYSTLPSPRSRQIDPSTGFLKNF